MISEIFIKEEILKKQRENWKIQQERIESLNNQKEEFDKKMREFQNKERNSQIQIRRKNSEILELTNKLSEQETALNGYREQFESVNSINSVTNRTVLEKDIELERKSLEIFSIKKMLLNKRLINRFIVFVHS